MLCSEPALCLTGCRGDLSMLCSDPSTLSYRMPFVVIYNAVLRPSTLSYRPIHITLMCRFAWSSPAAIVVTCWRFSVLPKVTVFRTYLLLMCWPYCSPDFLYLWFSSGFGWSSLSWRGNVTKHIWILFWVVWVYHFPPSSTLPCLVKVGCVGNIVRTFPVAKLRNIWGVVLQMQTRAWRKILVYFMKDDNCFIIN